MVYVNVTTETSAYPLPSGLPKLFDQLAASIISGNATGLSFIIDEQHVFTLGGFTITNLKKIEVEVFLRGP